MMRRVRELLATLLEPREREAVMGDVAEAGLSGWSALRDVGGVVARRQAQLFQHPRDWVMLLACCGVAWLLGDLCARTSNRTAVDSWLYFNNWNWAYLNDPAFRGNVAVDVPPLLFSLLKLGGWSWMCGFILSTVSRAKTAAHAVAFLVVLFLFELQPARASGGVAVVFSLTFYRVLLPLLIKMVLVVMPGWLGIRYGLRSREGVQA